MSDRMPDTTYLPLPEADQQGRHTKTQLVFHSTGTEAGARANQRYFSRQDIAVESTFIVDYDGEIVQVMPASARADANGSANKRAMSVEVIGTADQPFTPAQLAACIRIARWACDEHQVARRLIPTEAASGIGWHVMFGAPGPWTSVRGKECPGPKRIVQVRDVIIPAAQASPATAGSLRIPAVLPGVLPPAPTTEDDMAASFTFNDGDKTYWRDGGDTVHVPTLTDLNALHAAGVKPIGKLTPEFTARLVEAAKQ